MVVMNDHTSSTVLKFLKFISQNKIRSVILITGKNIKESIQNIHYLWIKSSSQKRNPILWCYKKNSKNYKSVEENIFTKNYFQNDITPSYCYYEETQKIIGNTYGMCV